MTLASTHQRWPGRASAGAVTGKLSRAAAPGATREPGGPARAGTPSCPPGRSAGPRPRISLAARLATVTSITPASPGASSQLAAGHGQLHLGRSMARGLGSLAASSLGRSQSGGSARAGPPDGDQRGVLDLLAGLVADPAAVTNWCPAAVPAGPADGQLPSGVAAAGQVVAQRARRARRPGRPRRRSDLARGRIGPAGHGQPERPRSGWTTATRAGDRCTATGRLPAGAGPLPCSQ